MIEFIYIRLQHLYLVNCTFLNRFLTSCGFLRSSFVEETVYICIKGSGTKGFISFLFFEQVPLVVITKYVHDKFRNSMVWLLFLPHFCRMLCSITLEQETCASQWWMKLLSLNIRAYFSKISCCHSLALCGLQIRYWKTTTMRSEHKFFNIYNHRSSLK